MKVKREKPCLCVICDCGEVIAATIIKEGYPIDDDFLESLERYAKEGYKLECKDSSEFMMNCTCNTIK